VNPYRVARPWVVAFIMACITAALTVPARAGGDPPPIVVHVDGLAVFFDVPPFLEDGRAMVPFRGLADALGVPVTWDGGRREVRAGSGGAALRLRVDDPRAYCGGTVVTLDVPPMIRQDRTLVPLRFFSEALDCRVAWDPLRRTIYIASPPRSMTVIGFYALGDRQTSSWTNLFGRDYPERTRGHADLVDELALGWYSLSDGGNLLTESATGWRRPDGWNQVLLAARDYDLRPEMVVHVTDSEGTIGRLITDDASSGRAVEAIAREAALHYRGVNLDMEGLGWRESGETLAATRQGFTEFVRRLAARLRPAGLGLTLTLHAPNSAYRGYDYRALGEAADRIIVMAYDYGQRPEPAALVVQAVAQALDAVPPERLLLGISLPSETPESLVTKVGIAKRHGLAGIALWRLGLLTLEDWRALETTVQLWGQ